MTETTTRETQSAKLEQARKLLTKAGAVGVTQAEAESLTAKASALMAKYGIDRAALAATQPETDKPTSLKIYVSNPWARANASLLCGIIKAMRGTGILVAQQSGWMVHLFGYESDIERANVLFTSILLQQASALRQTPVPDWTRSVRAWRRSWVLGYNVAVVSRVKAAEATAVTEAEADAQAAGTPGMALVLADRSRTAEALVGTVYDRVRKTTVTYSGGGYHSGQSEGYKANLGGTGVSGRRQGAIG